jgi:hypothetical protein
MGGSTMSVQENHLYTKRHLVLLFISILVLFSLGCILATVRDLVFSGYTDVKEEIWYKALGDNAETDDEDEEYDLMPYGSAGDETTSTGQTGQDTNSGYGELKPVGFVNYGESDAAVRAYTFIPLGKTEPATPSKASTTSVANDGAGTWPNTSRFISVPMGAYSWCIDWEDGDVDDDGIIDYFHYIQDDPTILDENDSDDLELAEEVAISAPPSSGAVYEGKCKENLVGDSCVELNSEVNVYSLYAMDQGNPPDIKVAANAAEQAPPIGIDVSAGGVSTGYGTGMILWQEGDWVEVTTSDSYQALGVQVHGDQTIGWARALFDGQEIWRGDASTYTIAEGRFGVYIEVRCSPPGTHTLRIEGLGLDGSGGGRSIPVSYFGFRE